MQYADVTQSTRQGLAGIREIQSPAALLSEGQAKVLLRPYGD
jgi:hypothetical protein